MGSNGGTEHYMEIVGSRLGMDPMMGWDLIISLGRDGWGSYGCVGWTGMHSGYGH